MGSSKNSHRYSKDTAASIIVSPSATTVYCVTVNNGMCSDNTCLTVFVDIVCGGLFVPNAFSPNNDGINDTFFPKGIFISKYEMMIFDRWGNLIFFSDELNKSWDGIANYGSEIAQPDVYVYAIKGTDINRKKHNYKGVVTLVR